MMRLICAVAMVLVLSSPAYATTYWASVGSSNTIACNLIDSASDDSSADPGQYGTIERAAECATVAGDIVNIKPGTYTSANDYIQLNAGNIPSTGLASGTSETNRTIVQGVPGLAKPEIQRTNSCYNANDSSATGYRDYITIKHLICNQLSNGDPGGGTIAADGAHIRIEDVEIKNACRAGVTSFPATGSTAVHHLVIVDSIIHDTNKCDVSQGGTADTGNGYGAYIGTPDAIVERTEFYNVTAAVQFTFSSAGVNVPRPTFRQNYVHDLQRSSRDQCWGVVFEGPNATITRNVFDMTGCGRIAGIYSLGVDADNANISHNIIYNNGTGKGIEIGQGSGSGAQLTGVVIANNISLANATNISEIEGDTATKDGNRTTGSLTDCTVSTSNFTQKAGSSCINQGVATVGAFNYSFNGSAPDQGPFETFGFSLASVNENSLDVTLGMSLNTPVQNLTTNWTALVGGVARTTTNVSKLTGTDSVVRTTFSGAVCVGGETWTATALATGATDSALIGGTINQPMTAFTAQAVTNSCGSAPPPPPASGLHVHYKFDETSGTTAADEVADRDGTHTNGPTITAGKTGNGVSYPDGTTEVYTAVPYGSGLNISTDSLSICLGVLPHSTSPSQKIAFSTDNGTNQRFYIGWVGGTWQLGIQSSGFSSSTPSEFPVVAEWTRLCVVANAGTDTATLYVNGVKGATSGSTVKTYTSFTLASNFKVGVGTFSTNYGGTTADDLKIYAATVLTDQEILDDHEDWNPTASTPTGTYTQVAHQWQLLRTPETDYGAVSATVNVIVGGAVSLVTQVDCTGSDCDPTGLKLYYSCALCETAGEWLPVPEAAGADGVSFYGTAVDVDVVTGTVECCLSGALTENDGSTQTTAAAVPNVDMDEDASFTRRSVLKFTTGVTAGRTYCFQEYHQTGVALATPTPSGGACVTIASPALGVGF